MHANVWHTLYFFNILNCKLTYTNNNIVACLFLSHSNMHSLLFMQRSLFFSLSLSLSLVMKEKKKLLLLLFVFNLFFLFRFFSSIHHELSCKRVINVGHVSKIEGIIFSFFNIVVLVCCLYFLLLLKCVYLV
jgi:hypothetical protein